MLGAAIVGFLIAWVWRRVKINELNSEVNQLNIIRQNLEQEQVRLFAHSNQLQSEREKWLTTQDQLNSLVDQLSSKIAHLKHEKEMVLEEYNRFRLEMTGNKKNQNKLIKQLNNMNEFLTNQEQELLSWKEKYNVLLEIKEESDEMLKKLSNYREDNEEEAGQNKKVKPTKAKSVKKKKSNKKWQDKYKALHFKLLAISKERDEMAKTLKKAEKISSQYEIALNTAQNKETALDKVKDKFRKWTSKNKTNKKQLLAGEDFAQQTDRILRDIKQRKSELDFSRIGLSAAGNKDNLQKINGIGPFIEKKLNALGIYRFDQIARLNNRDIDIINQIIDLKPDFIRQDNWVKQAKKMK